MYTTILYFINETVQYETVDFIVGVDVGQSTNLLRVQLNTVQNDVYTYKCIHHS